MNISKQWHPTKNGNLKADDFSIGSHKKVWWKCPIAEDHEWEVEFCSNHGCPYCAGQRVVISNCLATTHPELVKQWHSIKNGNLTPFDVVYGSHKKVWWKCSIAEDHEWEAQINKRTIQRDGCVCCANKKAVLSNCLATTHPELVKQWHPIKNGNLTPFDVFAGSDRKVWWKCSIAEDHEWQSIIKSRIKQPSCPCCVNRKAVLSNCLATTHPELVKQWHPIKNGNLTPFDITFGSKKKIWWKCTKVENHEWQVSSNNRINKKTDCPFCKESKGEKIIREYLLKNNIDYKTQYRFIGTEINLSRFDFMITHEKFSGVIEYHGRQHYLPVSFGSKEKNAGLNNFKSNMKRDARKENFCKNNQIDLIVIPYWKINKINNVLDTIFKR